MVREAAFDASGPAPQRPCPRGSTSAPPPILPVCAKKHPQPSWQAPLLPEASAAAGLAASDVIVGVRPGRLPGPAAGNRRADHSEPTSAALRIEVGTNVRTAEG